MYNALPKNEKTFSISVDGDTSGEKFEGQFTAKCVLNMAEKHTKELEKTRLLSDYANPSTGLAGIAEILSTIRSRLIKWPSWWANLDFGAKMLDENVIITIYDELIAAETEWRSEIKKKSMPAESESQGPLGNVQVEG